MDQIMGILIFLVNTLSAQVECEDHTHVTYEYYYDVPSGLEVVRDWNEDGYFILQDEYGNSFDVEYGYIDMRDSYIERHRNDEFIDVLEEIQVNENVYKMILDNPNLYNSYDTLMFVENENALIVLYMYYQGETSSHSAFEDNALKLARSIVQGEEHESQKADNCGYPSVWDLLPQQ